MLRIVASDPFVRIGESLLEYCCLPGDTPNLPVSSANLSVETNLDILPEDIVYHANSDSFVMQHQRSRRPARSFTQKDINDGKISYNVHSAVTEVLMVRVGNQTLKAECIALLNVDDQRRITSRDPFMDELPPCAATTRPRMGPTFVQIVRRSLGASLELRRSSTLGLPVGGVVTVDAEHLEIGDAASSADQLFYHIIKQPQEGSLVLEKDTPPSGVFFLISRPSNGIVVNGNDLTKSIYNFSQKDIDDSAIVFLRQFNTSGSGGFSFLLSDGVHQIGPEWFSIESSTSSSPVLQANARLLASPNASTVIGVESLRANILNARPEEILFSVSKPPKYGKLLVDDKETGKFSQLDINRNRVVYQNLGVVQKEWTRKDSLYFVLQKNGSDTPIEEEFRFRISSTYAALADPTENYVKITAVSTSKGGSVAISRANIDVSTLAASAANEDLYLEISTPPRYGTLEFLDGVAAPMSWTDFQTEPKIIYRNAGEEPRDDSVTFFIYPSSEKTRRTSRLRVTLPIHITTLRDPLVQVSKFPTSISIKNSGVLPLTSQQFYASHPHVPSQSIVYELIQPGTAGTEIRVNGQKKTMFSQEQINEGAVSIGHMPSSSAMASHDVVTFSVEGHSRALVVRLKPLDLALENHTVIEYPQGKTYVLLNRTHLGAYSNGGRDVITYKITNGPENGTFYWVAGEKEAKQFTQKDIDEGKILYAQLNMHSYKDSFEFLVANTEKGVVRNRSEIRVRPLVTAQPVIVETNTVVPLTASQLNATALQGSTPRFLVTSTPRYGRVSLDPASNHSALFFTFPDILRVQERHEKENRINGSDDETQIEKPRLMPASDQIPVIILVAILFITVFVLMCRRRRPKQKPPPPHETTRLPPSPRTNNCVRVSRKAGRLTAATTDENVRADAADADWKKAAPALVGLRGFGHRYPATDASVQAAHSSTI
ncbi:unnamed protein product [Nippostrongylus brasiliensis]|uniref:Chondroitin sulfate proteoglycan 4 (inferred by orthology to a human protein) n=1 Tax=Nippostrongylus brasiliensis TaxID=27835 RepID=A0A0N4YKR0_NIPBR|nr:unnamed protein product [Nippostrongylus brasiliensis]